MAEKRYYYRAGTVGGEVERWLAEHGYEGLVNYDELCSCTLEELGLCGRMKQCCMAGYRVPCGKPECRVPYCDGQSEEHVVAYRDDPEWMAYEFGEEWWTEDSLPTVGRILSERASELGWYLTDGDGCWCGWDDWEPYGCAEASCEFRSQMEA